MIVHFREDGFEGLILLRVHGDALLTGPGLHGVVVHVILANVDVRLALELTNLMGTKIITNLN